MLSDVADREDKPRTDLHQVSLAEQPQVATVWLQDEADVHLVPEDSTC